MAKNPILKRYMRAYEVGEYTGLHPDTLNRLVKRGQMPQPVRLSRRVTMFDGVKISLRMSGLEMEQIDSMSEEQLMETYQTGKHSLDQNDPKGDDDENGRED